MRYGFLVDSLAVSALWVAIPLSVQDLKNGNEEAVERKVNSLARQVVLRRQLPHQFGSQSDGKPPKPASTHGTNPPNPSRFCPARSHESPEVYGVSMFVWCCRCRRFRGTSRILGSSRRSSELHRCSMQGHAYLREIPTLMSEFGAAVRV